LEFRVGSEGLEGTKLSKLKLKKSKPFIRRGAMHG
jgi:hypothetical protein